MDRHPVVARDAAAAERARRRAALLLPQLVVAIVLLLDIRSDEPVVFVGLLIIAPLLSGLAGEPSRTRIVSVEVVAAAALAWAWNDNIESWTYWVPLTVVSIGATFGWVVALLRARARGETHRMRILAQVAMVGEEPARTVEGTAQRIVDVLVPALAGACRIEVVGVGDMPREVARAGPEGLATEITVPLAARGRPLGTLALAVEGVDDGVAGADREYVTTLAGRVALALDNAGLSAELTSTEQQLRTIMETVDVAIIVRTLDGRMLYANQAAADVLQLPDVASMQGASSPELMDRFEVYTEDGDPVSLDDLPGTRLLRGEHDPPPLLVRNIVKETGTERWLLNKAMAVEDESGRPLMVVNSIEDVTASKRTEIAQRILAEAGRRLAAAVDLAQTLQAIADMAVPGLADWATVDLVEPRVGVRTVAVAHRDPAKVQLGWRVRQGWPTDVRGEQGLMAVLRTGRPLLLPEIDDALLVRRAQDAEHLALLREVGICSGMIVPMLAGEEVLGALSFGSATARRFDEQDLQVALDLGREAGVALRNARLNHERAEIAETLQRSLVPRELPPIPGWTLAAAYRPAGQLNDAGGDFYDAFAFAGGWAVVIGDVAGKGAAAAAVTALVRHRLAAVLDVTGDPVLALRRLNDTLCDEVAGGPGRLCSVAVLVLEEGGDVVVHSAGHPLPVLCAASRCSVVGRTGVLLGVRDDVDVGRERLHLEPGERLVLYTDGVLDATGATERFGEARLLEVLSCEAPGAELPQRVVGAVDRFLAGDQPDDIAVVVVERAVPAVDERPSGAPAAAGSHMA